MHMLLFIWKWLEIYRHRCCVFGEEHVLVILVAVVRRIRHGTKCQRLEQYMVNRE